ncbi:MAG: response regulator [Pseudolabrys sp.]|nr:response regulator [Pseudolabrys sp.]
MDLDLLSIRLLCVLMTPSEQALWRRGAGLASAPVDVEVADATAAADKLARGGIDVCIVDSRLPAGDRAKLAAAAAAVRPKPFLVISAPRGAARLEGVDGMLPRPTGIEEARKLVDICIRLKVPTPVLIVDDSSTMRSIVRKILSASRFPLELHEASEGRAALDRLRGEKFGLVFLDYNMPGLNGIETLSDIRRDCPNVAVVMMTSVSDSIVATRAQLAGALAFLKKPFYPADIDAVLERYFGLRS